MARPAVRWAGPRMALLERDMTARNGFRLGAFIVTPFAQQVGDGTWRAGVVLTQNDETAEIWERSFKYHRAFATKAEAVEYGRSQGVRMAGSPEELQ